MTNEPWEDVSMYTVRQQVLGLNLALDAVACRESHDPDDVLAALSAFAQAIDGRAAALIAHHATAIPAAVITTRRLSTLRRAGLPTPAAATGPPAGRPGTPPPPAHSGRTGRARRRLLAVPLLACLALAIAVPISTSPNAPLYPLHHLLFDRGQPSPAESVRLHLTNARRALDRAVATIGPPRAVALDDARHHLTEARGLIPRISDARIRLQLDTELDHLDERADQLANADQPDNPTDSNNHNNRAGENGQHVLAGTNIPQNGPAPPGGQASASAGMSSRVASWRRLAVTGR
jgi:hypothetical protein